MHKNKQTIVLQKQWPIKLAVLAVVSSGLMFGGLDLLASLLSKGCSQGIDGLGCAIAGIILAYIIMGLLLLVGGAIAFRYFLTDRWRSSIVVMLPTASLTLLLIIYGNHLSGLVYDLIGDSPIISLLWTITFWATAFYCAALLHIFIFRVTETVHWALSTMTVIILPLLYYFTVPPLLVLADTQHFQQTQLQDTQKVTFQLYKPSYVPVGYKLYTNLLNNIAPDQAPYYEISYLHGNNDLASPGGYGLYEFAVPASYNPPADCGDDKPEYQSNNHLAQACEAVAHTKTCDTIYYAAPSYTNVVSYYCLIGKTLITYEGSLDRPEIIKVFDSLVPATAVELRELQ